MECAFVDNKKDIAIIDTAAKQKKMGIAIAKGVLKTLGIKWTAEKTATEDKKNNEQKIYRVQVGAFSKLENAENLAQKLKAAGFEAQVV